MTETVLVPGAREVRASLDRGGDRREPPEGGAGSEATRGSGVDRGVPREQGAEGGEARVRACVVACPPHPRMGGSRTDRRLRAVSDHLSPEVDCLRFDYGAWDEGRGEVVDCRSALAWARERYARVGLFGYSFGAGVALVAAARESLEGSPPAALSVLAPPDRLNELDAAGSVADVDVDCPLQVLYAERDSTVDSAPVVAAARERGATVVALPADHHFVGQDGTVGEAAAAFLVSELS